MLHTFEEHANVAT